MDLWLLIHLFDDALYDGPFQGLVCHLIHLALGVTLLILHFLNLVKSFHHLLDNLLLGLHVALLLGDLVRHDVLRVQVSQLSRLSDVLVDQHLFLDLDVVVLGLGEFGEAKLVRAVEAVVRQVHVFVLVLLN